MKICSGCGELKLKEDFSKHKSTYDGLQAQCRACNKAWRSEYYKKFPERNRKRSIKQNYGISMENLKYLHDSQSGKCAICGKSILLFASDASETMSVGRVDHCHTTGKVRGLLCHYCNLGLGHFKDNLVAVRNAVKYLEEYE